MRFDETLPLPPPSSSTINATPVVDDNCVYIAVMGATGSGKTTFINLASGSNLRVGGGLESCTSSVQMAQAFKLDGRSVTLIDTPGFDDTSKSDSDILHMIAAFLAAGYESGKKLAGVIYLHRISDFRMSGISTRNFKMFRQLCGEKSLKNVVIVTNMWGEVSTKEVGDARERELATKEIFFEPALAKGASMKRHSNTPASAYEILRTIVHNHPLALQIQRELVDQKKDISETSAGKELNKEWEKQLEKHQNEMKKIQEEMAEAIRDKDKETKHELETAKAELQRTIAKVQNDAEGQVAKYKAEKGNLEKQMQVLSESTRETEKARAEYARQMTDLQAQLNKASLASAAERDDLHRKIRELESRPSGGGCYVM